MRYGALGALLGCLVGCSLDNPGFDPPEGLLAFPIDVQRVEGSDYLLVVNANFDLKYNRGSLQVWDLTDLGPPQLSCAEGDGTERALDVCQARLDTCMRGDPGGQVASDLFAQCREALCDGRVDDCCCFGEARASSELLIKSYATDMALSPDQRRVYVAGGADDGLRYVGFDPASGQLCGARGRVRCPDSLLPNGTERAGDGDGYVPALHREPRQLSVGPLSDFLPAAQPDEHYVMVGHVQGQMTFLRSAPERTPEVLSDFRWPDGAINVTPTAVRAGPAGDGTGHLFYAPTTAGTVWRFSVLGEGPRDLVQGPSLLPVGASVTRYMDLAFGLDGSRVFLLSEQDSSVQFGWLDPTVPGGVHFQSSARVSLRGAAPSRIEHAVLDGREFLFVSSFDERRLYVLDAELRDVAAIVSGFSGPFQLSIAPGERRAYVADWRSSVIRVVDLRGLTDPAVHPPHICATIGAPRIEEGFN